MLGRRMSGEWACRQRRRQAAAAAGPTCASRAGATSAVPNDAADVQQRRMAGRGAALASLQVGGASRAHDAPCKHMQTARNDLRALNPACLPCSCRRAAERKAACEIRIPQRRQSFEIPRKGRNARHCMRAAPIGHSAELAALAQLRHRLPLTVRNSSHQQQCTHAHYSAG